LCYRFFNFMALLLFQCTAKCNLGVFLCKFAHCGLVFGFVSLLLFLIYLLFFEQKHGQSQCKTNELNPAARVIETLEHIVTLSTYCHVS